MSEPRDLRDLVGDDVPPEELAELERVDALLRSVPPPPAQLPPSLARPPVPTAAPTPLWTRRRVAATLALAAALSALFFGAGFWVGDREDFETRATIRMQATENAEGASAVIKLGERDEETGNWELELEVSGLPPVSGDRYYVLWLERDGEYAATCGTFTVGEGKTSVYMNVSYQLAKYDAWVISEHGEDVPPLLRAEIA